MDYQSAYLWAPVAVAAINMVGSVLLFYIRARYNVHDIPANGSTVTVGPASEIVRKIDAPYKPLNTGTHGSDQPGSSQPTGH